MTRPTSWPRYARVPLFLPVTLAARAGGWSTQRQADFIGHLAEAGSVVEAARRVGMSRMAAYRLRRCAGAESLAHAWDTVVALRRGEPIPSRKVTPAELPALAFVGGFHVLMRKGLFVRAVRKPSNSALLRHLRRIDAALARAGLEEQ